MPGGAGGIGEHGQWRTQDFSMEGVERRGEWGVGERFEEGL